MEFSRTILLFVLFLAVLFFGPTLLKESFKDVSGSDTVTLSLKDLMFVMKNEQNKQHAKEVLHEKENSMDEDFYKSIKDDLLKEVRSSVRNELKKKEEGSVLNDSCIDSIVNQQGTQWMKYVQGKNPDDYIRKDSIPCYGCSLA